MQLRKSHRRLTHVNKNHKICAGLDQMELAVESGQSFGSRAQALRFVRGYDKNVNSHTAK